ncbi:MAG: YjgP/YjgQ family permease [Gemmatimonadales bacterium]|nr:MAG: YjgP/YjgQ family permease [Gemmatimonadales bacterium]
MSILTRYVIRAHLGPFLFAFTAVTGLLFLNAVAQRLEDLAGKGLGMAVIGEFMLLSLPHIIALTFPMAVLVAVLYTFSDLTARNEVMAMAAGGIRVTRVLFPVLLVGAVLAGGMLWFNARVLPESNHRLSNLVADIGSKSPTLELREQVINEVRTADNARYRLRARTIDPAANVLSDVTIYDLSRPGETRVIVAREGQMAFTEDRADLYLTLEDGTMFDTSDSRPGAFQRMDFERQILPFRGVGTALERRGEGSRGEREMTIGQLRDRIDRELTSLESLSEEQREATVQAVAQTLGLDREGTDAGEMEALLDDGVVSAMTSNLRTAGLRWNINRLNVYRYEVEVQKKYSIAFACFVFVLLGAAFAVRFPSGGVGMVIATSVVIFFFYWAGLIGGERLADRGLVHPTLAMWFPNLVLLVPALLLSITMGRSIATSRGGGWDSLVWKVKDVLGRPFQSKSGTDTSPHPVATPGG